MTVTFTPLAPFGVEITGASGGDLVTRAAAAKCQADEEQDEGGDDDSQDDTPSTDARSATRPWAAGIPSLPPKVQPSPARRACQARLTAQVENKRMFLTVPRLLSRAAHP